MQKWIPACSEGGEFWLTLFLTIPIKEFLVECLKDTAKEGVIYAGKKYILEPLKKAIRRLRKSNESSWGLKIQTCLFKFDDVEICIGAIKQEELEKIEEILVHINCVKDKLSPPDGFKVTRIELPVEKLPSDGRYCLDSWRFEEKELLKSPWMMTYADNHKTLYNPLEDKEYNLDI